MTSAIVFEWNEAKRLGNLRKHGLDFANCSKIFAGPHITVSDSRFDYGEMRYVTYGLLNDRVVVVGHTEIDDVYRVITMRKATKHEQAFFFTQINY